MKKVKIVSVLILLLSFAVSTSCSKYEEGPAISLLPKKTRLVRTWKLDKIVYPNGEEENVDNNSTYEYTKDNVYRVINGNVTYTGQWSFTQDKEYLKVSYTSGSFTFSSEDQILRLKNDELWMQRGDDEYHYVPVD